MLVACGEKARDFVLLQEASPGVIHTELLDAGGRVSAAKLVPLDCPVKHGSNDVVVAIRRGRAPAIFDFVEVAQNIRDSDLIEPLRSEDDPEAFQKGAGKASAGLLACVKVPIILLASYIEAVINLYLSFAFGAQEFKKIDELSIFKKWTSVPARRIPSYSFDRESEVFKTFESLVECRNSIAHMRPEFMVDGKIIHAGNGQLLVDVSHKSIMRWIRLPLELVDMMSAQDKSDAGQALRSVSDVWDVSQGWDERLSFYVKQYAEGQGERRFSSWPLI